jgi:23S rRNA (cytidine2498-2'-O)-methyltransferase
VTSTDTPPARPLDGFLAWCRPGFENDCAQELAAHDARLASGGFARARRDSGYVEFILPDQSAAARYGRAVDWRALTFARQWLRLHARVEGLPTRDRLALLMPPIRDTGQVFADAWIESPDSDGGRELAALCRSLNAALVTAMKRERLIDPAAPQRLHVALLDPTTALLAVADVSRSAPWPGGIPRLRFPSSAPSRSTLKLEEGFLVLLDEAERDRLLRPGMTAVDLGAAPGGWTWQLVRRSIQVTAIDNGPMDETLLASGLVDHRREDGFRYQPPRPVDWLVCDMVEQPRRVAARIGDWLAAGWCRHAMFNLKLPMKKRYDEVVLCRERIAEAAGGRRLDWRARQLYHDREEVTVYAALR